MVRFVSEVLLMYMREALQSSEISSYDADQYKTTTNFNNKLIVEFTLLSWCQQKVIKVELMAEQMHCVALNCVGVVKWPLFFFLIITSQIKHVSQSSS